MDGHVFLSLRFLQVNGSIEALYSEFLPDYPPVN